jgi:hypothetical protein
MPTLNLHHSDGVVVRTTRICPRFADHRNHPAGNVILANRVTRIRRIDVPQELSGIAPFTPDQISKGSAHRQLAPKTTPQQMRRRYRTSPHMFLVVIISQWGCRMEFIVAKTGYCFFYIAVQLTRPRFSILQ